MEAGLHKELGVMSAEYLSHTLGILVIAGRSSYSLTVLSDSAVLHTADVLLQSLVNVVVR